MATRQYKAQDWIFREGMEATHCYVLQSGKVQLTRGNGHSDEPIAVVVPGECFGEIAVLDNVAQYGCGAIAVEACTAETITMDEFQALLNQNPSVMLPLFKMAFEQLKRVSLRASTGSTNTVQLNGIERVTLRATNDMLIKALPHTLEIALGRLPYKIGGYPENGEINSIDNNNLYLPCKSAPLMISRQHCQLDVVGEQLVITDLGSRFNTVVNDMVIGRGRGIYKAALVQGDNIVRLGGLDSPYCITFRVD